METKEISEERGISVNAVYTIVTRLPTVIFPGLRKLYACRDDVAVMIDANTVSKDGSCLADS